MGPVDHGSEGGSEVSDAELGTTMGMAWPHHAIPVHYGGIANGGFGRMTGPTMIECRSVWTIVRQHAAEAVPVIKAEGLNSPSL